MVFLSADINMCHETGEPRTNVCISLEVDGWMDQANNFVCGILEMISTKSRESTKPPPMMYLTNRENLIVK